ncbi:NAD-dependent protein deacylase [Burkholderiales bacterium]|nr:NAD-dependent protein deacylase [Burkholderiales bacterium]
MVTQLRQARHVLVFTGAGVSAESGIATFRDALTGLWTHFRAEDLATSEGFRRDPELVWGWYEARRAQVLRAQPNPAHRAIATLGGQVPKVTVITQNVDDLHERAGSAGVVHLHGSLHAPRCASCGAPYNLPALPFDAMPREGRLAPPRCVHCGGLVRPGVVWFGEMLPERDLGAAQKAALAADLMLCVGTSGVVWPAAGLPGLAREAGATVVQVNAYASELDALCQHNLRGPAGEVLPRLLAAAF